MRSLSPSWHKLVDPTGTLVADRDFTRSLNTPSTTMKYKED